MNPTLRRASAAPRGFSLIELLLAIFILGVGVISVAAVFPAGIIQQRRTQDDILGPVVAEAALSTIRSRVSQGDFGTLEEFGLTPNDFGGIQSPDFPNGWLESEDTFTQVGDWPWIRPSIAAVPPGVSPTDWPSYAGDIDLFSARSARASGSIFGGPAIAPYPNSWSGDWRTTEFSLAGRPIVSQGSFDGNPVNGDPGAFLFGVPFNRAKFGFFQGDDRFEPREDPLVEIRQSERFWPAGSGFANGQDRPQYAWDVMFRRFQGRVQVAIFVYRLNLGNAAGGYAVCQDAGGGSLGRDRTRPPMPARVDLAPAVSIESSTYAPFTSRGLDPTPDAVDLGDADRNLVRGTNPDLSSSGSGLALDPYFEGWQAPGQWIIDPYGRTHRVLQGRRNRQQGPVRLARGIPTQTPAASLVGPAAAADFADWQAKVDQVRSIWFVPPNDRRGISLTPVYVAVREL